MTLKDLEYVSGSLIDYEQKATTLEIPNPDHESNWNHLDDEMLRDFYEGATWARDNLGKRRNQLVGHFLFAVMMAEENDDPSYLTELTDTLTQPEY